jgi:hypothetical protein
MGKFRFRNGIGLFEYLQERTASDTERSRGMYDELNTEIYDACVYAS